jgi:DNA-binding response OmpR family regulator
MDGVGNFKTLQQSPARAEAHEEAMSDMKRILIVDDEEDVRMFLRDFLSERDFHVDTAASGEEALERFDSPSTKPDITLLDIMMPGMDGLECLEKIKKNFPKTTVIMITALKDENRIAHAQKLGAQDYIIKPFSLSYLEAELEKLLKN